MSTLAFLRESRDSRDCFPLKSIPAGASKKIALTSSFRGSSGKAGGRTPLSYVVGAVCPFCLVRETRLEGAHEPTACLIPGFSNVVT